MNNLSSAIYSAWVKFKPDNVRFLGFGDPHVPDVDERVFYAFSEGFKAGAQNQAVSFDLAEPCDIQPPAEEVE